MRLYEPAWNRLKNNPSEKLVISAHKSLHRRIFKAIQKEKHQDTVYHLELESEGKKSTLGKTSDGNALVITLAITYRIDGIF